MLAPFDLVMDLEVLERPALPTPPAIPLQHAPHQPPARLPLLPQKLRLVIWLLAQPGGKAGMGRGLQAGAERCLISAEVGRELWGRGSFFWRALGRFNGVKSSREIEFDLEKLWRMSL